MPSVPNLQTLLLSFRKLVSYLPFDRNEFRTSAPAFPADYTEVDPKVDLFDA